MAETFFDNPPTLSGEEKAQLAQLYRYLNSMSEKLNQAMNSITTEQLAPETRQVIKKAETEQTENRFDTLKSLIIKTADIVRSEMDEIRTELHGEYLAISEDFGEFQREVDAQFIATAEGIEQNYALKSTVTDLRNDTEEYKKEMRGYIFTGIVEIEGGEEVPGIAIGQNVTDEETGELIDENKSATFTAERLTFYQNGIELAYFSNNVFHIAEGEVTRTMKMGNHIWKVLANGALALIAGKAEES